MVKNLKPIYRVVPKGKYYFDIPLHTGLKRKFYCAFRALQHTYITEDQLISLRRMISRSPKIKRTFKVYPDHFVPITHKPAQARMGGGKGVKVTTIIAPIRPGQPILKLFGRFRFQTSSYLRILKMFSLIARGQRIKRVFSKLPFSVYINFVIC